MKQVTAISELCAALETQFGAPTVPTAWVAGSGTLWLDAQESRGGVGIPEVLNCTRGIWVQRFKNVATDLGIIPRVTLMDIDGSPAIRVPFHGWHFPYPTVEDTLATYQLLHYLGVRQVVTDATVGGIRADPWDVVIPDDVITNDPAKTVIARLTPHVGLTTPWFRMAKPFCQRLRRHLYGSFRRLEEVGTDEPHPELGSLINGGTYYTMPLGTFETAAEIAELERRGMTIVGQSTGQEAIAARLCGMCFAAINPVVNFAEGTHKGAWSQTEKEPDQGMDNIYAGIAIPIAVIVWWTLQKVVKDAKEGSRQCDCEGIHRSVDLSGITPSLWPSSS